MNENEKAELEQKMTEMVLRAHVLFDDILSELYKRTAGESSITVALLSMHFKKYESDTFKIAEEAARAFVNAAKMNGKPHPLSELDPAKEPSGGKVIKIKEDV